MGYWAIDSIGRPYIVPPGRSGPGRISVRNRGSRGISDNLLSEDNREALNAKAQGEEEE